MRRVGLAQVMVLIAVLALGLAAMKVASEWAVTAVVLGSAVVLLVAMLGALVRERRAGWVGFSLFAWGYILILVVPMLAPITIPDLVTRYWSCCRIDGPMANFADWLHSEPPQSASPFDTDPPLSPIMTPDEMKSVNIVKARKSMYELRKAIAAYWIGLVFQGLAFACCGAFAGHLLDDRPKS